MLTGTLVTVMTSWMKQHRHLVGTPTDDPELLEQFDVKLEDADASTSQVYESASRSFQETRELLSRVESARGYFPVIGIGAFDALAQPSTDRRPAKSRGKGKKGKRNRKSSSQKGGKSTWHLDKTTDLTFRVSDRSWRNSWWTTSRSSLSS